MRRYKISGGCILEKCDHKIVRREVRSSYRKWLGLTGLDFLVEVEIGEGRTGG